MHLRKLRAIIIALVLFSSPSIAHQPDWPEEVCSARTFKLFLEQRKPTYWTGQREVYREEIVLTGQRIHAFGVILIQRKLYSIPADQYAMLEHCFSYPPLRYSIGSSDSSTTMFNALTLTERGAPGV